MKRLTHGIDWGRTKYFVPDISPNIPEADPSQQSENNRRPTAQKAIADFMALGADMRPRLAMLSPIAKPAGYETLGEWTGMIHEEIWDRTVRAAWGATSDPGPAFDVGRALFTLRQLEIFYDNTVNSISRRVAQLQEEWNELEELWADPVSKDENDQRILIEQNIWRHKIVEDENKAEARMEFAHFQSNVVRYAMSFIVYNGEIKLWKDMDIVFKSDIILEDTEPEGPDRRVGVGYAAFMIWVLDVEVAKRPIKNMKSWLGNVDARRGSKEIRKMNLPTAESMEKSARRAAALFVPENPLPVREGQGRSRQDRFEQTIRAFRALADFYDGPWDAGGGRFCCCRH